MKWLKSEVGQIGRHELFVFAVLVLFLAVHFINTISVLETDVTSTKTLDVGQVPTFVSAPVGSDDSRLAAFAKMFDITPSQTNQSEAPEVDLVKTLKEYAPKLVAVARVDDVLSATLTLNEDRANGTLPTGGVSRFHNLQLNDRLYGATLSDLSLQHADFLLDSGDTLTLHLFIDKTDIK